MVFGSVRPRNSFFAFSQEPPQRHEEQALVLQRVPEGGRTVGPHHVDALQESIGCATVDHLFNNQRADHFGGRAVVVLARKGFLVVARFDERQDSDGLGVRFVDIGVDRRFDLRRQV